MLIFFGVGFFVFGLAEQASAATNNIWNSSSNTDYNTASNWSLGHIPTTGEVAYFDATSTVNCTLSANITPDSINVTTGYTGTLNLNGKNVSGGDMIWNIGTGGTINFSSSIVTSSGDFTWAGALGTITRGTSQFIMTGNGKQLVCKDSKSNINKLTIAEGATITIPGSVSETWISDLLTINGILTINSGGTLFPANGITQGINGAVNGSGKLNFYTGTLSFANSSAITPAVIECYIGANGIVVPPGTYSPGRFNIVNRGNGNTFQWQAGTYIFTTPFEIDQTTAATVMTISGSNNPTLEFRNNVTITDSAGTLTFSNNSSNSNKLTGTANQSVILGGKNIGNWTVNKPSAGAITWSTPDSITAGGNWTSYSAINFPLGTSFDANGYAMNFLGNFKHTGTVLDWGEGLWTFGGDCDYQSVTTNVPSTASIIFNGTDTQYYFPKTGATVGGAFTVNKSSGTFVQGGDISATSFTETSGTLDSTYIVPVAPITYQVVHIGDSLITNFQNTMPYSYANKGIGGQTITQIAARFTTDAVNLSPRVVLIDGGINNLVADSQANYIAQWTTMLNAAQSAGMKVVAAAIFPSTIQTNASMQKRDQWTVALKSLCASYSNCAILEMQEYIGKFRAGGDAGNYWDYADGLSDDGLHLNATGNAIFAQRLNVLMKTLGYPGHNLTTASDFTIGTGGQIYTPSLSGANWTVGGAFSASGQSGTLLNLNPASVWHLNVTGNNQVSYANVAYSDASGGRAVTPRHTTDLGNNTNWNFDVTAPTTSDDYGSKDNIWQNSSQTITLTPYDADSGIAWTKYCTSAVNTCDPSIGNAYTVPIAISAAGTTYFRYASQDNVGNTQTTVSRVVKIDSIAPTTPANVNTGLYNSTQNITLSCDDGSGVGCDKTYYTTDGNDPTTGSTQYSSPISISTTTTLKFFSKDLNGNSESIKTKTYTIDTTPPDTVIDTAPNANTNATSASFTFHATETSTFQCKIDSGAYSTCTSPKNYTGLSAGAHTFFVKATDLATNEDPTPATSTWTIDLTAPTATASPIGGTYGAARNVTLSCDDGAGSGCDQMYYTTNGSTPTTGSTQYASPINIAANTTLKFFAKDVAGNSESVQTETYGIDATYPVTDIDPGSLPDSPTFVTSAHFTFSANKAGSTFECKLDSGAFAGCASPQIYSGLSDGAHTFQVRATDTLSHVEPMPASYTWTVDTVAPQTTITDSPAAQTKDVDPIFQFTSSESNSTFECQLDAGSVVPCTSPKSYSSLSAGTHTFSVTATDQAGNIDETPAIFTFTIDLTAPILEVTAPNEDASINGSQTISFTDSEQTDPQCSVNNIDWTDCASGVTKLSDLANFASLPEGDFVLHVKDTDIAGNTGTTAWTLIKDTEAPTFSNATPDNQTFPAITTSVTLSVDTNKNATCRYSTHQNAYFGEMTIFDTTNAMTHSTFVSGLTSGTSYTYFVKCVDVAGNVSAIDGGLSFGVDKAAQSASVTEKVKVQIDRGVNTFKDTLKIASATFKLKSQDQNLANGTVKVYKGGKLWKTISADASGAWSSTLKLGKSTSEKIKVMFYDVFGTLIGDQSATIRVDSENPTFTAFITPFYSISKGGILYWEATDNVKVDHFKVTFNGKIKTVKKARFTVPQDTPNGTYEITVKVYDTTGNSATKRAWVRVR